MANPYFIRVVTSTVTSDQIVFTGEVSCSISGDIVDLETGSVTLSSITMKNTVTSPAANQVIALATITDACGSTGNALFTATATNIDETLTQTTPGDSVITQFKTSNSPVWLLNNAGTVAQISSTLVTVPQTPGGSDGVADVTGSGLPDGFILSFPTYTTGERLGGLSDLSGLYLYYQFGDGTNRGPLSFYNISGSELTNWTTNLIGTSGNATLTLSGGVFDASNTNPAYNRVEAQLSAYNYLGASTLSNYVSDIPTNGAPPDISGLSGVNYALNVSGDVEVVLSMTINEGNPEQLTQSLLIEVDGTTLSGNYNISSPSGQLELSLNVGTNPTGSQTVTLTGGSLTQGQAYTYKVTPYSEQNLQGVAGNTSVVSVTSTNVPAAATASTTLGALTYDTATNTLYNPDVDCTFAILLDTSSNYERYTGYTAVPTGSITFTPTDVGVSDETVTVASNDLSFGDTTATIVDFSSLVQGRTYSAVINLANVDGTNVSGLTTSGGTPTPNPSAITDLVIVSTTSGGGVPVEQVSYTDPNTQYYTNERTYYVLSDSALVVLISGDITNGSGAQTFTIGSGEDVNYDLTNDTLYYLSLYPSSDEYPAPTVTDLPETSGSFLTNAAIPADASAAMLGCLQDVSYSDTITTGTDCIVSVYVQADASYVIALNQDPSGQTTTYSSSTGIIQVAASSLAGYTAAFTAGVNYTNIIQVRPYAKDANDNAEYGPLTTFDSYALATAYLYTGATQPPVTSNGDWLTTTDISNNFVFIYKVWNGGYDDASGNFSADVQAVNGSGAGLPTKWLVDNLILVHPDGSNNALIEVNLTNPQLSNYRTNASDITSVVVAKTGNSGVTTYTIGTSISSLFTVPSIGTTNNNCGTDAQIKEINPN